MNQRLANSQQQAWLHSESLHHSVLHRCKAAADVVASLRPLPRYLPRETLLDGTEQWLDNRQHDVIDSYDPLKRWVGEVDGRK